MARQPHNAMVLPFRRDPSGPSYLLLRRSDDGVWQGVSGGVEDGESIEEAALRESQEELGLNGTPPLFRLSMVGGAPRSIFGGDAYWPAELYIVQKHFFGADLTDLVEEVVLSREHTELAWLSFDAAHDRLTYTDEKTALWELDQRIARSDLF